MTVAKTTIDVLLRRTRDIQGSANSRDFVRTVLGHAQRVVNLKSERIIESVPLTTEPYRLIYPITANFPNCGRIVAVREDDRDLDHVKDWRQFRFMQGDWFRATDTQFESYATIGRELLLLYKAKKEASSVDVVYIKSTGDVTAESQTIDISDEGLLTVEDLAEVLLLLKKREYGSLPTKVKMLAERFGVKVG